MKNYLALLGVVGAVILGFALHSLGTILVPFITGIIGAYILNHPVTALSKIKVPRGFGALLMILGVLFLLGTLMMVAVPFLQKEFILLSKNMPALVQHFYSLINPVLDFAAPLLYCKFCRYRLKVCSRLHMGDNCLSYFRAPFLFQFSS